MNSLFNVTLRFSSYSNKIFFKHTHYKLHLDRDAEKVYREKKLYLKRLSARFKRQATPTYFQIGHLKLRLKNDLFDTNIAHNGGGTLLEDEEKKKKQTDILFFSERGQRAL